MGSLFICLAIICMGYLILGGIAHGTLAVTAELKNIMFEVNKFPKRCRVCGGDCTHCNGEE